MVKRRRKEEVEVRTDKVRYHHLNELERAYCVTSDQALLHLARSWGELIPTD
jgi:hypothetical protein